MELTLYYRTGCHLCDDMRRALAPLQAAHGFDLREIDIDRDPALAARWNADVPVLARGDTVLCRHFLDEDAVLDALNP